MLKQGYRWPLGTDINEILHTPTPSFKSEDTCIWAETKDGLYSVKGAYHMIMNNFVNQETCSSTPPPTSLILVRTSATFMQLFALILIAQSRLHVMEGEAWALRATLNIVVNMGLTNVLFEMDNKSVVDKVKNTKKDESEAGIIISECEEILASNKTFHLGF
ncbi:hypothetical protein JHK85_052830 [Glycine max]|uniref:RNase H type-1 domain-containing protein n=1 Tax=Glycine max TaxID=3847 RepID=A0A0R0EGU5_SOYBN|nr:hypothetical protein JHK87_052053 [Glycine soja]KAG4926344.1 hypothetical protein JHK85_052830 [Glycine max]